MKSWMETALEFDALDTLALMSIPAGFLAGGREGGFYALLLAIAQWAWRRTPVGLELTAKFLPLITRKLPAKQVLLDANFTNETQDSTPSTPSLPPTSALYPIREHRHTDYIQMWIKDVEKTL